MPKKDYIGSDIQVLEGLEAVRKRPGMYIGDTGEEGLHHMIWEIVDNSIDEVGAGYGDEIQITLHKDNSITVRDFGRGIPVDIHPTQKMPTVTVVLTVLHAGAKFDSSTYKTSGGLHGVGASVVNALSEHLIVEVCRDGKLHKQEFKKGIPITELEIVANCRKTGTKIWFKPDATIFKETQEFKEELILERIESISYLNPQLKIVFKNEKTGETKEYKSENGLADYVAELCNEPLFPIPLINEKREDITLDVAFVYHKTNFDSNIISFTNNVLTKEGGTHEVGTLMAFSRAILSRAKGEKIKDADKLKPEDVKEGLSMVISIKIPNPEFRGQTKGKLNNTEARTVSYAIVKDFMDRWIEENPKIFKKIIKKIQAARKAREAAKRSRDNVLKESSSVSVSTLPGKLADCQTNDSSKAELFIVEGDSAGGSAKLGRDRVYQAILPLKGKILNTQKSTMTKALANEEIKALILALGVGLGKDYKYEKLRYGKIIIMSDADVDGGHIQFLNLLFLYKFYPELIEKGHVYVAVPPLYRAKKGDKIIYLRDEKERKKKFPTPESEKGWIISRFKGLGEMDPEQLWETTMNPKTRTLVQVKNDENAPLSMEQVFELLGGDNVKFRKALLLSA